MRLYHTGTVVIQSPDIYRGRVNADFGRGFYLTPDQEFTYRWAGRNAVINVYDLDISGLKVHRFSRDPDWFEYIFSNRRAKDTLEADIVIGPIANDTIYDTMGILTSGYLSPEEALKLLMIGPEYTQVVVKSEKAVRQLQWVGTESAPDPDRCAALLREEQKDYQSKLARALSEDESF